MDQRIGEPDRQYCELGEKEKVKLPSPLLMDRWVWLIEEGSRYKQFLRVVVNFYDTKYSKDRGNFRKIIGAWSFYAKHLLLWIFNDRRIIPNFTKITRQKKKGMKE